MADTESSGITPVALWFSPATLERLRVEEERIRDVFNTAIASRDDLTDHLGAIHACMDALEAAHRHAPDPLSDRNMALYTLEARLFNAAASILKLGLSGYYSGAISFLRDIVEISFLLDYFKDDHSKVDRWAIDSNAKEFKPVNVRNALDKRDGPESSKRREIYGFLSSYGTHADYKGKRVMSAANGLTVGPFVDLKTLSGLLPDTTKHLLHAVGLLSQNLAVSGQSQSRQVHARYMLTARRWWERYMGREMLVDPEVLAAWETDAGPAPAR